MNYVGSLNLKRFMCLLVRQNFSAKCENALNKQINLELKACQDYLAMAFHFNRSDTALTGAYEFFKKASDDERCHGMMIMGYMNKRGGTICLEPIPAPKSSYESLFEALKVALEMERSVNESLLEAHAIASEEKDPNMTSFIEAKFLDEQVDAMKQLADYITNIERCNNDLGTYIFDLNLKESEVHPKN